MFTVSFNCQKQDHAAVGASLVGADRIGSPAGLVLRRRRNESVLQWRLNL